MSRRQQPCSRIRRQQRFVSQPRNIGSATTHGIELEAKGRLNECLGRPAGGLRAQQPERIPLPGGRHSRTGQPARRAAAGHRQPGRRLPLPEPAAGRGRQPELDARLRRAADRGPAPQQQHAPQLRGLRDLDLQPGRCRCASRPTTCCRSTTPPSTASTHSGLRDATATRSDTRTQWSLRLELKL